MKAGNMNLKEALKRGKLKQFAKEHEIKPQDKHPQAKERFDGLMDAMVKGALPKHPSASKADGTSASNRTSASVPSVG